MDFSCNIVGMLIQGLFNVQSPALDSINETVDIYQGSASFFEFPIRPKGLNAQSCPFLNYFVNWEFLPALSPLVAFVIIFNS
jgi:hypothetical protein